MTLNLLAWFTAITHHWWSRSTMQSFMFVVSAKCFAITNNSFDTECEKVRLKWPYWALECCLKEFLADWNSFNSTFRKHFLESLKHSYCFQNNEPTKTPEEINNNAFHDFIGSNLERTNLLIFCIPLMNAENLSWWSAGKNWEKEDLKREKNLTLFPGKINIEVDFFMQYVHTHYFEITQMLKIGYSNDQQKMYRIQNPKLGKINLAKLP